MGSRWLVIGTLLGLILLTMAKPKTRKEVHNEESEEDKTEAEEGSNNDEIDWSFPFPAHTFEDFVNRGKAFARQYIGEKKMKELHSRVHRIMENGGSRKEIHKTVLSFINKVLTNQQKEEINHRKAELNEIFGKSAVVN